MFPSSDNSLDDQLRSVPVPAGLAERILALVAPSDDQLDARLRGIVMPESLGARLHDIPADLAVEEALTSLAPPLTLLPMLRLATPRQRLARVARQVARLALAALWFCSLSLALAGFAGSIVRSVYQPPNDESEIAILYNGPLPLVAELAASPPVAMQVSLDPLPLETPEGDASFTPNSAGLLAPPAIGEPDVAPLPAAGPVTQWTSLVAGGLRPMEDVVILRYGILGSPHSADDRMPDLEMPLLPRATGIAPPLVRGYDRGFFLKHRVFPPISPAANPQLAALAVPLVTESDVLARLGRAMAEGRALPAADLRTEDFLAAMDYRFAPAPAGKLALRTAAGPAPFGPAGTGLVQIGVQAGPLATRVQRGTHLVVALDLSHSMARGGRLEMVQQGLSRLVAQLGTDDRLSLVVFQEEIIHCIELASRADAPSLRQLVGSLAPRGGTNLAGGLQRGAALAMAADLPLPTAKRLVLITDSPAEMPAETLAQVRDLLASAGEAGVRLDVLDLADHAEPDAVLVELAGQLAGHVLPVRTPRELSWALLEALAGTSPVIAAEARLTLRFNPKAVAAYRLIGHEASALAEITPAAVEAQFAAGEAATALVQLWFQPADVDDLGTAELTWHDAAGQLQTVRQRLSRLQFAPTFGEAAISLQQASLAAQVADELRGTPAALREIGVVSAASGLGEVLATAKQAHPQLRERAEFQRLLDLVRTMTRGGAK
ncbi:MAG: VWA domain-containing protein [Pirellulaceae bacterium]|nr:VWA domain-containing protein [Pirellulaceae bacterium]